MSYLTIEDINPDKRLSVAIAVTFEVSVYHLHESPDIKGCLLKALRWENYGSIELRRNSGLSWDIARKSQDYAIVSSAHAVVSPCRHAMSSVSALDAAIYAYFASNNASCDYYFRYEHPDRYRYIGVEMRALLPLILDYKINVSKQAFKDSERVFELLDEDLKEKFLFNLDILQ